MFSLRERCEKHGVPESSVLVHEVKLAAADADGKWCLDEIEVARDVQRFPRQGVVPMDSGRRKSATPGTKTGLATQTAQKGQFRTRTAMTAELWSKETACRQTSSS